jgi:excisionase family DNA binding protein
MVLFDIPQTAKELRLAPVSVRRLLRAGLIPHHRLGGKILFTPEDLKSYLDQSAIPARTPAKEAGHE